MTFPPHLLYSFRGHFGDSAADVQDIWSCGLRVTNPIGALGQIFAEQILADDAIADWVKFHTTTVNVGMATNTWIDYVRLYQIGSDGKATGEIFEAIPDGGPKAGKAGPLLPFQCAVVATLDTDGRDKPRTGRIFLPLLGTSVQTNGRMIPSQRDQLADAVKTLIDDLNNLPGVDTAEHQVSVVSGIGAGKAKPVTTIRVGDLVDTMRSRRNALDEAYVRRVLAP